MCIEGGFQFLKGDCRSGSTLKKVSVVSLVKVLSDKRVMRFCTVRHCWYWLFRNRRGGGLVATNRTIVCVRYSIQDKAYSLLQLKGGVAPIQSCASVKGY